MTVLVVVIFAVSVVFVRTDMDASPNVARGRGQGPRPWVREDCFFGAAVKIRGRHHLS